MNGHILGPRSKGCRSAIGPRPDSLMIASSPVESECFRVGVVSDLRSAASRRSTLGAHNPEIGLSGTGPDRAETQCLMNDWFWTPRGLAGMTNLGRLRTGSFQSAYCGSRPSAQCHARRQRRYSPKRPSDLEQLAHERFAGSDFIAPSSLVPAVSQIDGTTFWSIAPKGAVPSAARVSIRTRSPKRMKAVVALPSAIISMARTSEMQLDPTSA
jgi:hypothetical protein